MEFGVEYSASGKSRLGLNELKCAMPHSEKEEDIKFVFSFPLFFFFFFFLFVVMSVAINILREERRIKEVARSWKTGNDETVNLMSTFFFPSSPILITIVPQEKVERG